MPALNQDPFLQYEHQAQKQGYQLIIGVDEAGRGPLAGPVVAAAVAVKDYGFENRIADSKKLSAAQREKAFDEIMAKSHVGVGIINERVIDEHNISNATFFAMTNAVNDLLADLATVPKTCILVDGNRFVSDLPHAFQTIVGGDSLSMSIACASIIAKVTRDRILRIYHNIYPQYGFDKHKGYPTQNHRDAIKQYGLSLIHRRTFR